MIPKAEELFATEKEKVIKRGFHIASSTVPGLRLFVRELRSTSKSCGQPVLLVHGATLSSYLWDIDLEGYSWMEYLAQRGCPSYAIDVRGYGRSSKLTEMERDPQDNSPYARGIEAIEDIDDTVEFIRNSTGYDKVDLVGGSWGSITCGMYASTIGKSKIRRLILTAPIFCTHHQDWIEAIADPVDRSSVNPKIGAYRWVTEEAIRLKWDKEIPASDKESWRPEKSLTALLREAFAADSKGSGLSPKAFRAPNGTFVDLFEAFSGRPLYDPKGIEIPTMLIRAAQDSSSTDKDARALFTELGSQVKRYVLVGHGTHFFVAEKNNWQLFAETEAFLSSIMN